MEVQLTIALSFGGGRQTTALLLMAVAGEMPRPDYVVFADTGSEWPETYDYMARYVKPLCEKEGLPFVTVTGRGSGGNTNLYDWLFKMKSIPFPTQRRCTVQFKISPIHKLLKTLAATEEWIGFSFEEQGRAARKIENMRPKATPVKFPLLELRLRLTDCENIVTSYGWPLPMKSSCICCCFQHPNRARLLFERYPDLFEKVGLLEDNALARAPGYYILGNKPWRFWGVKQANIFGDDWNYGCADGYCFR